MHQSLKLLWLNVENVFKEWVSNISTEGVTCNLFFCDELNKRFSYIDLPRQEMTALKS